MNLGFRGQEGLWVIRVPLEIGVNKDQSVFLVFREWWVSLDQLETEELQAFQEKEVFRGLRVQSEREGHLGPRVKRAPKASREQKAE